MRLKAKQVPEITQHRDGLELQFSQSWEILVNLKEQGPFLITADKTKIDLPWQRNENKAGRISQENSPVTKLPAITKHKYEIALSTQVWTLVERIDIY